MLTSSVIVKSNMIKFFKIHIDETNTKMPNTKKQDKKLLVYSAENNLVKVQAAINSKADFDACDEEHNTALHLAAQRGHIEIVKVLLKHGTNCHRKNLTGATALHLAVEHGHEETVKILLANGSKINALDNNLNTPLIIAIQNSKIELSKLLIAKGAKLDEKNKDGNTALHLASAKNDIGLVGCLLAKGANINVLDAHLNTFLIIAISKKNTEMVESLQLLVDNRDFWNKKNDSGNTALHFAAARGYSEIVEILLKAGADLNPQNKDGSTPLITAVNFKVAKVVKCLVDAKAKLNLTDVNAMTALDIAVSKGNEYSDIINILLSGKANPESSLKHATDTQVARILEKAMVKERYARLHLLSLLLLQGWRHQYTLKKDENGNPICDEKGEPIKMECHLSRVPIDILFYILELAEPKIKLNFVKQPFSTYQVFCLFSEAKTVDHVMSLEEGQEQKQIAYLPS